MAPEQWQDDEVDARTDQFALCVALWEALYGERPFRGESVHELMFAVTEGPLARAPEGKRRAPAWLGKVLERGCSARRRGGSSRWTRCWPSWSGAPAPAAAAAGVRTVRGGAADPGVFALRARSVAGCAAAGRQIEEVWNERAQAALHAALLATGAPFAESSYQKALPRIDRWAGSWSELRSQVCTEAEVDGTRSPALYRQSVACLDEQRETLAALLEVFTADSAANVQRLVPAVAGLAPLEPCAEKSYLERMPAPPDDAATRERVHALRRELQQARGRLAAGDCSGCRRPRRCWPPPRHCRTRRWWWRRATWWPICPSAATRSTAPRRRCARSTSRRRRCAPTRWRPGRRSSWSERSAATAAARPRRCSGPCRRR
ncbi:hypothetical protein [Nannocystis pusilla]|uniref:hypothetical protein n=1 Tax=Nannocystis pusilla TaxID=889268 RepID=UPI003B7D8B14